MDFVDCSVTEFGSCRHYNGNVMVTTLIYYFIYFLKFFLLLLFI